MARKKGKHPGIKKHYHHLDIEPLDLAEVEAAAGTMRAAYKFYFEVNPSPGKYDDVENAPEWVVKAMALHNRFGVMAQLMRGEGVFAVPADPWLEDRLAKLDEKYPGQDVTTSAEMRKEALALMDEWTTTQPGGIAAQQAMNETIAEHQAETS